MAKKTTLINANDNSSHSIYFYQNGSLVEHVRGCVRYCLFLGSFLYPAQTSGVLGYGVLLGANNDNSW